MLEEINRHSVSFTMYLVIVAVVILFVGAIEISMSVPIGMTQGAANANFASKSMLSGGLTRTAAIIAMPKLVGINHADLEFDRFSGGISVGGDTRANGYRIQINGIGFTEDQSEMMFPYGLPIDNFFPESGIIHTGEVKVVYFYNVRWTGLYQSAEVRDYPEEVLSPFGEIIDFEHVVD